MQINLNKTIVGLDDKPVLENEKEITLGRVLSEQLVKQSKGSVMKFFDWAKKLYNCDVLNLDREDKKLLRDFIENNEQLTILVKAQIFEILDQE